MPFTHASLPVLVLALALGPAGASAQDHHAAMNARGAEAMGFDQDQTTHHFLLHADGATIDISVKRGDDAANRDAIRMHLPHIATAFAQGNFDLPHFIHATDVPGAEVMARLRDRIRYRYEETAGGGRLRIVTADAEALSAIHAFMRFQITDHHTGDPLTLTPVPAP
ncbi:MAG: hypothetical protein AB7O67_02335 [Vicinamibacterales bacterium]